MGSFFELLGHLFSEEIRNNIANLLFWRTLWL